MSDQPKPIDLNTASLDELASIPGIGPAIADRIQARRPYQSVDELAGVPGIGQTALEKIRPFFFLQSSDNGQAAGEEPKLAEAQLDEAIPDAQVYEADVIALPAPEQVQLIESDEPVESEIEPQSVSDLEPASELEAASEADEPDILLADEELPAPEPAQASGPTVVIPESKPASKEQPRFATRGDAFWISFGSSLLGFILAIGLTLGALALINNGLRYVSPAQLSSVSRQVDGLNSQASILQQDLDGLRTRVDNLEGLSGRVSTVEQTAKQLQSDLDAASTQVEQLNQDVSGLQTDVTELKTVSGKFQNFLDGLRELLNNEQQ